MERRNRRNYGALRSTRLLSNRHHRPPHRPHPCDCDCGCHFYRPEWAQNCQHALLTAGGEVTAGAGEAITFTGSCGCNCDNHVLLLEPGIYYAHYTLHMPGDQVVNSDIHLMLDDQILPHSLIHIEHNSDTAEHATGHAMFEICFPTHLHLVTQQHLNIRTDGAEPLITLAVFRIG